MSLGIIDQEVLLDLDYKEDSNADTDLNLVVTEDLNIIEIQGTAEEAPFSQDELNNIIGMGKELGKDYWEIAKLKLTKTQNINTSERKQNFIFGTIIESKPENQKTGEIVIINMEIKSQLKIKPNVKDVSLIIDFYDIVDDVKIQTTLSDHPQATWKTMPIDWTTGKSEIVEWKYHLPSFSTEEKNNFESRRYYGFVSRLYYKNILQDIYATPRTLLEPKQSLNNSFIDSSLFPPVND